ncbi:hypothetical protein CISIN_1g045375mg [Citrus sinensis]|uniref:Uncharacterized protein n=1 Tax=Citrus sinensis TaxID=2711 RepID=A0A067DFP6_CITSI|nr:hypothetical protein CISIN_1g045375mg [Citrus sinensis]
MALSNNVIGPINLVAVLLSIPVIGARIWLAIEADNSCVKLLQWPVIILGILILVVALAGFIGGFGASLGSLYFISLPCSFL